ncbi:NAD(P)/FAD-dependent oxidoreductase [Conexibacter sp. SYSU D00693]|uniref:phytoene desaturase family protein n=1 Tax=Conexibacter sp. SYSU D00693 TaxID=2812560 RepID=UPI00196B2392|nr:phytoene desaturase family protein [Conexibacter sp. SYSU D00693]
MRVVVVGAGVGGLAAAVRLQHAGHDVTVLEQSGAVGGKCSLVRLAGHRFDAGPSLLTMPHVLQDLLRDVGAAPLELLAVEPVTRYRFADGTAVELSADRDASAQALERWSPGAGEDWRRFLAVCDGMWRASERFLTGPPPWPPRRPGPGEAAPDPRDGLAVRPWQTLRGLARATVRDPRLRMVVERFATYAGSDPRRAPAALAVAGYVEHAFGAWHPRGGLFRVVEALVARFAELGGELRIHTRATGLVRAGARVDGVRVGGSATVVPADAVVWDGDALALARLLHGGAGAWRVPERSSSGLAVLLAVHGRTDGLAHHELRFPADLDAEFDDLFVHRRPVRDPTVYVSAPAATDPASEPEGQEGWFVLVNAPTGVDADWEAQADRVVARLGVADRVLARHVRSPHDLATETGAVGGAIYGAATHGRLGAVRRPGHRVRGVRNLLRVGGTAHPGGGLPLVMLGGALVARELGPA